MPEFENAYKELDLIHNGGEAMEAFANLGKIDDEKLKQRYRDSLLEYCKLDTLAMVKILEKLKESELQHCPHTYQYKSLNKLIHELS